MGGDRGEAAVSRRLRLLNAALRAGVKPLLRWTGTPAQAERSFRLVAPLVFRVPRGTRATVRSVPGPAGRLRMTRIAADAATGDGVILYFHGGGHVAGSARTHRAMLARLSAAARLPVDAPDCRLAQEARLPAAFEDAVAVWEALVAEGFAPERVVLGGDSAGGGLALSLLADLCGRGTPPAGLFAFSPWTDLSLTGASLSRNAAADPLLPAERIGELVEIVLGPYDPRDPRVSPLFGDFPGAPPVLLQAGRTEILLDDTLRMADRLRAERSQVSVELWDDTPHVWQIFGDWLPESRDARTRAAEFARGCLQSARLPSR
jgi:epsilon-lactone hydrolase